MLNLFEASTEWIVAFSISQCLQIVFLSITQLAYPFQSRQIWHCFLSIEQSFFKDNLTQRFNCFGPYKRHALPWVLLFILEPALFAAGQPCEPEKTVLLVSLSNGFYENSLAAKREDRTYKGNTTPPIHTRRPIVQLDVRGQELHVPAEGLPLNMTVLQIQV